MLTDRGCGSSGSSKKAKTAPTSGVLPGWSPATEGPGNVGTSGPASNAAVDDAEEVNHVKFGGYANSESEDEDKPREDDDEAEVVHNNEDIDMEKENRDPTTGRVIRQVSADTIHDILRNLLTTMGTRDL